MSGLNPREIPRCAQQQTRDSTWVMGPKHRAPLTLYIESCSHRVLGENSEYIFFPCGHKNLAYFNVETRIFVSTSPLNED